MSTSTGSGARLGERLDGRLQPALGQDRGVDAAGELAQLLQRERQLLAGAREIGIVAGCRAPPAAASARARRAAAARRRAGCAPAAGAPRRPPATIRARDAASSARDFALASAWAASSAKSAIRCSAPGGRVLLDAGDDHRAPQPPSRKIGPATARDETEPRSSRASSPSSVA